MKKKLILLPFAGLFLYVTLSSYYYGPAYAGLGDRTGATGTSGCGPSGCHASSAVSSTTVTVQLLSSGTPVTSYIPGNVYTLKISATNTSSSSLPNFGFQMSVVKSSGAGTGSATYAGTMGTAPAGTHVYTGSSAQIFEHYSASFGDGSIVATTGTGGTGTTYVETISWTAPSSGTGSVVIYGVVNAVNHNLASDPGDFWNTAAPVTICEQPAAITGTLSVCGGATTTLSDATTGGTWSSVSPSIGSVSTSGVVTGTSVGSTAISYTTSCGSVGAVVTVNAVPSSITGPPSVCSGGTITLTDASTGGSWSSASPTIATASVGGGLTSTVTGVSTTGGTSVISYTFPASGCAASTTVTVYPNPGPISGTFVLCQGASTTLSDPPISGTWTSSTPTVATIGSSSGILNAVVTGSTSPATALITFTTAGGCHVTQTITVNPLPGAIAGTAAICPGATTTLTDPGGGSWLSGTPSVATIGSSTGLVTGISATGGTTVITYSLPSTGCSTSTIVTVNPSPAGITGVLEVCPGGTTSLTDAGGGTWTSGSPLVATIGSSSGTATGVLSAGGTSMITYALPVTGCSTTAVLTVNPAPGPITGTLSICPDVSTSLGETGSGLWSSSITSVGTIDPVSGLLTGISAGNTTISYTLLSTGCFTTSIATVNPLPFESPITGTLNVCTGATTTLSDATTGGTWSSSNSLVASIGTSGVVTGVGAGVATISYALSGTGGCVAYVFASVTVNPNPPAISGPTTVCSGSTITLSEPSSGNWSSNIPGIATVTTPGSTSTLSGVSPGAVIITHTSTLTGCSVTETVTVNPNPGVITGTATVCIGSTTTLSSSPTGGTWSSSTTHATIGGTTGIVTGATSGTSIITYALGTGCFTTRTVTVNNNPSGISGPTQVCVGSTTNLTDAGGGTWASSNANATISGTGVVTGVTAGTTVITYTLGTGCYAISIITINALPANITGPSSVCAGQTITLNDISGTSTWSSSNPSIATAGSATGVVTGIGAGTVNITFTIPATGCTVHTPVTVNSISSISGLSSLCAGTTTTLTDASTGGTWLSTATSVATIGTAGLVTAIGTGSTIISYTLLSGCFATATVNVISAPATITGPSTVCMGVSTAFTDAGGGTWTSSNPSVATVGSLSGIVTPIALGSSVISYSLGTGCTVSSGITVNPIPGAITGSTSVCVGSSVVIADPTTPGGTWTASNGNATISSTTGTITGVTQGTTVMTYTGSNGCINTRTETINPLPSAIFGTFTLCAGSTSLLTNDSTGGTWISSPSVIATIGSTTGLVSGVTAGTGNVTYTISATGCNVREGITVNPTPGSVSILTGGAAICVGSSSTLSSTGSGTWSSSNANAIVGSTGIVTGVTAGTSVISYTNGSGCFATKAVTINPIPNPITGTLTICAGSATLLGETTTGGAWSSSSPSFATVTAGTVTGVSAGTAVIAYTISGTGCAQSATVTINPLPGIITGTTAICPGGAATLTDGGGGSWSSSSPAIATIGSTTGLVTSVSAGVTTISYSLSTGCARTTPFTVNPLPAAIAGIDSVCIGATTALTDGGGGSWTSGSPAIASVGASTGIVTGAGTGTTAITYTLSTGCSQSVTVTVHASPAVITGTTNVCAGAATTLSDGTIGGTWSSSTPATATIGTSGIISGLAAGTTTITYLAATGCSATTVVTVNPLPSAITGASSVCVLGNDTLSDAGSGTWTSSGVTFATVGSSSGIVTGVATGSATITYTLPTGCIVSMPVTVNPLPDAGSITGPSVVCADSSINLSESITGGAWSSSHATIAGIGTTGIVSGVAAGTDSILYSVTNSCGTATASKTITVNPLPVAGTITGPTNICFGSPVTYTDTAAGGNWSSSNTSVATIGSATGILTSIIPGITNLVYTVTTGCGTASASKTDTVVALIVAAVSGIDSVCQGDTVYFSDVTPGGIWSVSNSNAGISSTGRVIGVNSGTDSVIYTITNVCGSISSGQLINIRSVAVCDEGVKSIPSTSTRINVYPNPSTGLFTVELPETEAGTSITISDVLGKTIQSRLTGNTGAQKVVFDLSHVAAGSYIIKVDTGNSTFRDKIVIW